MPISAPRRSAAPNDGAWPRTRFALGSGSDWRTCFRVEPQQTAVIRRRATAAAGSAERPLRSYASASLPPSSDAGAPRRTARAWPTASRSRHPLALRGQSVILKHDLLGGRIHV
jgi:hypothetical protein